MHVGGRWLQKHIEMQICCPVCLGLVQIAWIRSYALVHYTLPTSQTNSFLPKKAASYCLRNVFQVLNHSNVLIQAVVNVSFVIMHVLKNNALPTRICKHVPKKFTATITVVCLMHLSKLFVIQNVIL